MSGSKRRGESTAPALFPFLAVLLCTIGALILILVITVSKSQASAKQEVAEEFEDLRDTEDLVQSVSEELQAQRDKLKNDVERKRRELEHIEDHITRLHDDMERMIAKAHAIEQQSELTEEAKAAQTEEIAKLKVDIDQRKKELADEIEKHKKSKPAFAIIPYDGPNGTNRRPIYLECTRKGVIIQPEGLLITLEELRPPHGPGNPLDAALRVLRVAYQKRDTTFGIMHPPYPLLIVRPDGITAYAMARSAMGGWDDQMGYELVDQDMPLVFPTSPENLKHELEAALDLARKRQSLLVANMPRRPRSHDGFEEEEGWGPIDSQVGNGSSTGSNGGSSQGGSSFELPNAKGDRWEMIQPLPAGQQMVGTGVPGGGYGGAPGTGMRGSGLPVGAMPNPNASSTEAFRSSMGSQESGANSDRMPAGPYGSSPSAGGNWTAMNGAAAGANGAETVAGDGSNGNGNQAGGNQGYGNSAEGSTFRTVASNGTAPGGSGSSQQNGNTISNGSGAGMDAGRANAFSSGTASNAGGGAGGASSMQSMGGATQPSANGDPNAQQIPNVSVQMNQDASSPPKRAAKHVRSEGDLTPISVSAGRDWAAIRAESKATPVTRPIRIVALNDRWLIRTDNSNTKFETTITMENGPQEAGNALANAIRKRVDSWGVSVKGGYWVPSLTIETASDASLSVARLQRLLEGSGVEIRVVPLQLPQASRGNK